MSQPRTIFITGVTGLIAHGIARWFLARGDRVVGSVRRSVTAQHPGLRVVPLDLTSFDPYAIAPFLSDCDAVVHAAAIMPNGKRMFTLEEARTLFRVNAIATYELLVLAERCNVKRFVYLSGARFVQMRGDESTKETTPFAIVDTYSTSKLCGELACQEFQNAGRMATTTLRISAPYGYIVTSDAVIPKFIRRAIAGEPIELWGTGTREQIFTFVDDIAAATAAAIDRGVDGTFTITSGQTTTMRELADAVLRAFPDSQSEVVMTGQPDFGEARHVHYPIDRAREHLGYTPAFNLDAGLAQIARYLRAPLANRCLAEEVVPARV